MKKVILLATIHWLVLIMVAISAIICIIKQPLYLGILIVGVCFRLIFSSERCPITEWEDDARKKAGMETTNGKFIKYYYRKLKRLLK